MSARPRGERSPHRGGEAQPQAGARPGGSPLARPLAAAVALADGRFALGPDAEAPWWRERDGTRHSFETLRCGLGPAPAARLGEAHLAAICELAAAALAAAERCDRREARRLATAAGRLCGEIAGLWPPHAVAPR